MVSIQRADESFAAVSKAMHHSQLGESNAVSLVMTKVMVWSKLA